MPSAFAIPAGSPQVAEAGTPTEPRRSLLRRLLAVICMHNHPARLTVHYSLRFSILVGVVAFISTCWIGNFFFSVLPILNEESTLSECSYALNQLKYNANVLFIYFVWFSMARMCLFVPCILARVARIQSRTHGFCRTYCVHLVVRDGPIYILVVGSVLFWFNILQSPGCEESNPSLYQTLKVYAVFSCLLASACVIVVYWHNKHIANTLFFNAWAPEVWRGAPPDTLIKLETRKHNPDDFGDEDGKTYPSECAICLQTWEPDDDIKVTPCGHAFHQDCIGGWLRSARTCALCRKDLVVLTAEMQTSDHRSTCQPESRMLGSPEAVVVAAAVGGTEGVAAGA